jgi:lipid A 3-O-deacylase
MRIGLVVGLSMILSVVGLQAQAESLKMHNVAVLTSVGTAMAVNALGADTAGVDFGSDDGKERGRLLVGWDLPVQGAFGPFAVTTTLEVALGQATYREDGLRQEQSMANVTPVFDWRLPMGPVTGIFETGLGVAYLSRTTLGPDIYSTRFQFSQIFGLGMQWGPVQLGGRFQHVSNGGIEKPNNGQNWYGVVVKYHY